MAFFDPGSLGDLHEFSTSMHPAGNMDYGFYIIEKVVSGITVSLDNALVPIQKI
jgi:hypothetical protein